MHKYLRAIGFEKINKTKEYREILKRIVRFPDYKKYVSGDNDTIYVEYRKEFAPNMGIAVCGEYTEENEFEYDYSFPYFLSDTISSSEDISVERHAAKDSFAGVCDDYKIGVTLIFYLQNRMDYLKELYRKNLPISNTSVNLSGLSTYGTIMLPLSKNEKQIQRTQRDTMNRNKLIAAARQGDEKAIESLTLDDIDTYSTISRKMLKQDVYTLVDTYFMPYGVECDQYSIMGEILNVQLVTNKLTKEQIYIINMNCNDLNIDVCINKCDLIGEPAVKRRFKGTIWMQGHINFPN